MILINRLLFHLLLIHLILFSFFLISGCSNGSDDDDAGAQGDDDSGGGDDSAVADDDECIICSTTSECTNALGPGWVCKAGCCIEMGNDDDAVDDDSTNDDDTTIDDDTIADDDTSDDDTGVGDVSFSIEDVDRSGGGNRQTSIVLTPDYGVHIAYTGCTDTPCQRNELMYAHKSAQAGDWEITSIDKKDNDTGWNPSMVIDSDNNTYIVYGNHKWSLLYFALKPAGGEWTTAHIGQGRGGWWTSASWTSDGLVIAHQKLQLTGMDNPWLQVGHYSAETWTFEDVDSTANSGYFTSMAVTPDGRPVIAYVLSPVYPTGFLKMAEWTGSEWTLSQIDESTIGNDIAIDKDGHFHLVYSKTDPVNTDYWDLWYATNAPDGAWTKFALDPGANNEDDTGGFPHIAIDSNNGVHVSYRHFTGNSLQYARNVNGDWEFYIADPLGGGMYSSIAIDAAGGVHISYEDGTTIHHAYCEKCAVYGGK